MAQDPATYRLIELLTGEVLGVDGKKKNVPKIGDLYVYIAGPNICTANPNDYAPSNADYLIGSATYQGNGVVTGSILVDRDMEISEAGLLLMGPEIVDQWTPVAMSASENAVLLTSENAVLLTKTCLSRTVSIPAGSEVKVEVRFIL